MNEIESKFIRNYIIKEKRSRYLSFIEGDKNRKKFTDTLAHTIALDFSKFERIEGDAKKIIQNRILRLENNTDCYLISESSNLDKKRLNIDTALSNVIGFGMGTIIIFGDAEIIFYEAESKKSRWISR